MLKHIAIPLIVEEDIQSFYFDILGFEKAYDFTIENGTACKIFNVNNDLNVIVIKKDNLFFELFKTVDKKPGLYNHVCFEFDNFDEILYKFKLQGYNFQVVLRNNIRVCFVKDKSGNLFEIKESENKNSNYDISNKI